MDGLAIGLVTCASLNMDNVLLTVDRDDLSFLTLERATDDTDLIILSDWDGADL